MYAEKPTNIASSYLSVSKALDILKRQLVKATNDVKVLDTLKTEALNDPYSFIADLRKVTSFFL